MVHVLLHSTCNSTLLLLLPPLLQQLLLLLQTPLTITVEEHDALP
jgi:hypothetical protein